MSQHLAPVTRSPGYGIRCDHATGARGRFLDALHSRTREAKACGQRFGVYLVGLDRAPQLERDLRPDERALLLARARERLELCAESDSTLAFLRADTFGLLVPHLRNGLQAREAAVRILGALGHPMRASIGISVYPWDGHCASELLCCAAWALARARRHARATYCFYLRALATSAASSSPLL